MTETLDYKSLMHDAMRHLIRGVLSRIAEEGLPGAHHFYISFSTTHPETKLAPWLHEQFPEEMTIVLQHSFSELTIDDEGFAVTLSFNQRPERLSIPFDAIKTFVDPSVEFGLQLEPSQRNLKPVTADESKDETVEKKAESKPASENKVVQLDRFRK